MSIEIKAGDSPESIAVIETHFNSLRAAKARARYLASEAYAKQAEMPAPFSFVGVYRDGVLEDETPFN